MVHFAVDIVVIAKRVGDIQCAVEK